ncbi:MAG: hypothetical protein ACRCZY_00465 [Phocaeicola sp.]
MGRCKCTLAVITLVITLTACSGEEASQRAMADDLAKSLMTQELIVHLANNFNESVEFRVEEMYGGGNYRIVVDKVIGELSTEIIHLAYALIETLEIYDSFQKFHENFYNEFSSHTKDISWKPIDNRTLKSAGVLKVNKIKDKESPFARFLANDINQYNYCSVPLDREDVLPVGKDKFEAMTEIVEQIDDPNRLLKIGNMLKALFLHLMTEEVAKVSKMEPVFMDRGDGITQLDYTENGFIYRMKVKETNKTATVVVEAAN